MMSISRRRAASSRRSLSGRRLDPETTSSTTRTFCQRRRSRNSRSCRSCIPNRVLMRRRNAGVEADARERADLAFGVAKNPIARVSILARFSGPSRGRFRHGHNLYLLAMTVAVVSEVQVPKNGCFYSSGRGAGSYSRMVTHGPLE